MALAAQVTYGQERGKAAKAPAVKAVKSGPPGAKEYPLYVTFIFHIETGQNSLDERQFRVAAADLRSMAEVFKKHGGTLATHADLPFALACAKYGDNVLREIQDKYRFPVGSYPHGRPSAPTKAAVDALGVKNEHVFGNWGKRFNRDWVADAIANGFKYTCAAQAMVLPEVEIETSWDHETVPWSRVDRIHPWRIKSTEEFQVHGPNSSLVYIPGESEGIQGVYERDLTGNLVRPRTKRGGPPARSRIPGGSGFDSRDIDVAIEMMQKALVFAEKDKVNTWYLVTNITGRDRLDQHAGLFADWIDRINTGFVKRGLVEWKTTDEMYNAYVEWGKRTGQ
jgi:hypothetical protein